MQYPQRVVLGVTVLEVRHATHRNPPRLLAAAGVPGATSGGRGKPGRAEMSCADVMTASGEDPLAPSLPQRHKRDRIWIQSIGQRNPAGSLAAFSLSCSAGKYESSAAEASCSSRGASSPSNAVKANGWCRWATSTFIREEGECSLPGTPGSRKDSWASCWPGTRHSRQGRACCFASPRH